MVVSEQIEQLFGDAFDMFGPAFALVTAERGILIMNYDGLAALQFDFGDERGRFLAGHFELGQFFQSTGPGEVVPVGPAREQMNLRDMFGNGLKVREVDLHFVNACRSGFEAVWPNRTAGERVARSDHAQNAVHDVSRGEIKGEFPREMREDFF